MSGPFHCGQQVSMRAPRGSGLLGWELAEVVTFRQIGELQQLRVKLADGSLMTVAACHCRPLQPQRDAAA